MTKEIQLTRGQVALVDDEDFEYLNQWKWHAKYNVNNDSFYAARLEVTRSDDGLITRKKNILMHRLVMNTPDKLVCDHINHNTLDNQKVNLRNVTNEINQRNRKSHNKNNKSKHIGVHALKCGKFFASIWFDGKNHSSTRRNTIDEAIQDRLELERRFLH